jgi:hypothetical protein
LPSFTLSHDLRLNGVWRAAKVVASSRFVVRHNQSGPFAIQIVHPGYLAHPGQGAGGARASMTNFPLTCGHSIAQQNSMTLSLSLPAFSWP